MLLCLFFCHTNHFVAKKCSFQALICTSYRSRSTHTDTLRLLCQLTRQKKQKTPITSNLYRSVTHWMVLRFCSNAHDHQNIYKKHFLLVTLHKFHSNQTCKNLSIAAHPGRKHSSMILLQTINSSLHICKFDVPEQEYLHNVATYGNCSIKAQALDVWSLTQQTLWNSSAKCEHQLLHEQSMIHIMHMHCSA